VDLFFSKLRFFRLLLNSSLLKRTPLFPERIAYTVAPRGNPRSRCAAGGLKVKNAPARTAPGKRNAPQGRAVPSEGPVGSRVNRLQGNRLEHQHNNQLQFHYTASFVQKLAMAVQKLAIACPHQSPVSLEVCSPCHGLRPSRQACQGATRRSADGLIMDADTGLNFWTTTSIFWTTDGGDLCFGIQ
jgi:hypothetical protein